MFKLATFGVKQFYPIFFSRKWPAQLNSSGAKHPSKYLLIL